MTAVASMLGNAVYRPSLYLVALKYFLVPLPECSLDRRARG